MKLTIVIPALNEEEAIGTTIQRCLDARETIRDQSPVDAVEIIVVSDGSTDRTAEIASGYQDVSLIVFEGNRGYGAAIKKGFEAGNGELVGFLDADGTCDPNFFATLCKALEDERAAVAVGSRMGPESKMPAIRRLGNRFYAFILSLLSNRVVTDSASGMRVLRRSVLSQLYPLPDGLHFTPAMSARVLMDDRLTMVERPMSYEERIGQSKLRVGRDGVRFLQTILHMTLMWRPATLFAITAGGCLLLMILLAIYPLEMWIRQGHFDEDMIYRLLFCSMMGTIGIAALSAGVLADLVHGFIQVRKPRRSFLLILLDRFYTLRGLSAVALPSIALLIWLVGPGVWSRFAEGVVRLHWSRVVLASLIAITLTQMLLTVLIANILRFHTARKEHVWVTRTSAKVSSAATKPSLSITPGSRVPSPRPMAPTTSS